MNRLGLQLRMKQTIRRAQEGRARWYLASDVVLEVLKIAVQQTNRGLEIGAAIEPSVEAVDRLLAARGIVVPVPPSRPEFVVRCDQEPTSDQPFDSGVERG